MTRFADRVLEWYARNARALPWRSNPNPYRVWISEVMLQQTRVETVRPYFARWMKRFLTIRSLAAGSERSVLALWEGLGYYSRARSLQKAARIVVRTYGGRLPSQVDDLLDLPGIGAYTAAAIASIAFGRNVPTLDGIIRRVLSRVFCVTAPAGTSRAEKTLIALAVRHLPAGHAGDFNQALMELGALVCLPRQPRCAACPVAGLCIAKRRGLESGLPVRARRKPGPHLVVGAAVVTRGDRVLIVKRSPQGLLGGLWEFPKATLGRGQMSRRRIEQELPGAVFMAHSLKINKLRSAGVVEHAYSHFSVSVHAYHCATRSDQHPSRLRWAPIKGLSRYPMGKVDRSIALQLQTAGT
jgi:A/G-specific adenine glycosylase